MVEGLDELEVRVPQDAADSKKRESTRQVDRRLPGKGKSNSWREAGPANHNDDKVDSDQQVVKKEVSLFTSAPETSSRLFPWSKLSTNWRYVFHMCSIVCTEFRV